MSQPTLLWKDRHTADRILRFISERLAALFGTDKTKEKVTLSYNDFMNADQIDAGHVLITLPAALGFIDTLDGRSKSYGELQNILANQASTMSPLADRAHTLLAKLDPNSSSLIHCFTIRDETLEAIKSKDESLFVSNIHLASETDIDLTFAAPTTLIQDRFIRQFWAIACASLLFSTWACGSAYLTRLENTYETMRTHETNLRTQVLERSENARKITAYDTLANMGISQFTVSARLNDLQKLSSATPQSAWWHHIAFDEMDITVSGVSENAATALQALSENYPEHTVRFMRPLTNEEDGMQTYAIRLAGEAS